MAGTTTVSGRLIGARVTRVEDERFLTGEGKFLPDLTLPRMTHAAFVRSPYGHARVVGVDASRARQLPGVVAVITGGDLADVPPLTDSLRLEGLLKTPQPVLAIDRVRFAGEAVAVVVAEDRYLAEDAVELVDVEYEPLPVVTDAERAMESDAPVLFDELGTNIVYRERLTNGDVEAAFRDADRVVTGTYHTNRFMASPMETRGDLAEFERSTGQLTLWSSTQVPHLLRLTVAMVLGIPQHKVRVVAPAVGGGFGLKIATYPEDIVISLLARRLHRPVKWVEDRREHLMAATHSKEQIITLEAAVKADGTLLGLRARMVGDGGGYSLNPFSANVEAPVAARLMPSVYALPAYEFDAIAVLTNKAPIGAYRAVGWTAQHTARELLFDEIARELGMDPAEFRRKNMVRSDQFPHRTCTGMLYDSGSFRESLDKALEMVDYPGFRARQERLREEGRYIGIGISPFVELTAWGTDAGVQSGLPAPSHDNATVTLEPTGTATVYVNLPDNGQGHETTLAQVAAEVLGLALEDVRVVLGDTERGPFGMGTYASRTAVIGGGTVMMAAQDVRERVLRVAGALLEASPEDLIIEDRKVAVVGVPARALPLADVAMAAYFVPALREEGKEALSSTRFYDPPGSFASGCVVVTAEVDISTGVVTLERVVAVEDCGTVINPMVVEGQVYGAVAQGIGGALLEELAYDENAQLLSATFMDYLLPTAVEVPPIEVAHLESPSPFTVGGFKGMAEGGMIATPGAVVNAVVDALAPFGARVDRLPLTPDRVLSWVPRPGR